MKTQVLTIRTDNGRRSVASLALAASAIGVGIGLALRNPSVVALAGIALAGAGISFFVLDEIVLDGRRHLIRRRRGIWPIVEEVARPFSDVDHVCIVKMPVFDGGGSEVTVARLSLVRKIGEPIVLANSPESSESVTAYAARIAHLLGVESREGRLPL